MLLQNSRHSAQLADGLADLRLRGSLLDLTLAAEGKSIKAHRVVMASASPYFEELLAGCGELFPVVYLRDVSFAELENLVNYVYRGEVTVPGTALPSFLSLANSLGVSGFAEAETSSDTKSSVVGSDSSASPSFNNDQRTPTKRKLEWGHSATPSQKLDPQSDAEQASAAKKSPPQPMPVTEALYANLPPPVKTEQPPVFDLKKEALRILEEGRQVLTARTPVKFGNEAGGLTPSSPWRNNSEPASLSDTTAMHVQQGSASKKRKLLHTQSLTSDINDLDANFLDGIIPFTKMEMHNAQGRSIDDKENIDINVGRGRGEDAGVFRVPELPSTLVGRQNFRRRHETDNSQSGVRMLTGGGVFASTSASADATLTSYTSVADIGLARSMVAGSHDSGAIASAQPSEPIYVNTTEDPRVSPIPGCTPPIYHPNGMDGRPPPPPYPGTPASTMGATGGSSPPSLHAPSPSCPVAGSSKTNQSGSPTQANSSSHPSNVSFDSHFLDPDELAAKGATLLHHLALWMIQQKKAEVGPQVDTKYRRSSAFIADALPAPTPDLEAATSASSTLAIPASSSAAILTSQAHGFQSSDPKRQQMYKSVSLDTTLPPAASSSASYLPSTAAAYTRPSLKSAAIPKQALSPVRVPQQQLPVGVGGARLPPHYPNTLSMVAIGKGGSSECDRPDSGFDSKDGDQEEESAGATVQHTPTTTSGSVTAAAGLVARIKGGGMTAATRGTGSSSSSPELLGEISRQAATRQPIKKKRVFHHHNMI